MDFSLSRHCPKISPAAAFYVQVRYLNGIVIPVRRIESIGRILIGTS